MRIATWNINGLRARMDYLARWLEIVQPDIVGLQELKMIDEAFPHDDLWQLGYRAITHGQKSWNGVAILARSGTQPLEITQIGLPGQGEQGARLLTADVGGISFCTLYAPNGKSLDHKDFPRKLAWFDALKAHLLAEHDPDRAAVLCGDFNVVPAALDSWDEGRLGGGMFHTQAERDRLGALLELGWVDTWRAEHPEAPGFTWWDYRGGAFHRHLGLRIDLMLVTPSLAGRISGVSLDRRWRRKQEGLTPSDHAPLWIDLDG